MSTLLRGVNPRHARPASSATQELTPAGADPSRRRGSVGLEVLVLGAVALAVRLVHLDHTPYIDELYHALTARSLLLDGTLTINSDVPYTRGWALTYMVAGLNRLFGESLVIGRMPAVVAGVALVVSLFVWLRSVAGRTAAWIGALLLCFAPVSIYLSQQIRFYTLQTLFFWLGAFAVYAAATPGPLRPRRVAGLAAVAIACFLAAFHFQPVTAIGVAALGVWLVLARGADLVRWLRAGGRSRGLLVAGVMLAALLVALIAGAGNVVTRATAMIGRVDIWAQGSTGSYLFYYGNLSSQYPPLWTLLPVAVVIAASRYTRPALFLTVLFGIPFVFHSLVAWKHERYLFYALPAFFAICGLAGAVVLPWLRSRLETLLATQSRIAVPRWAGTALFAALVMVATVWAAVGSRATLFTYKLLTTSDAEWRLERAYRGESDWQAALPVLRPLADDSEVVVASAMLKALYFLDRLDVGLSTNELARLGGREFAVARREGVPVISTAQSLQELRSCVRSGIVVADRRSWRLPWGVEPPAADYLETAMQRVVLPERLGLEAFYWNDPGFQAPAECGTITARLAEAR